MKNFISFLFVLGICSTLISCKKSSSTTDGGSGSSLFSSTFNASSDLNAWLQSGGGEAVIDSTAVKFQNITGCFRFETANLISVKAGKSYTLKIRGKVNNSQDGDPALCAGDFLVYVTQGSTDLISASFGQFPAWTTNSWSFTVKSSASINIHFLIGTTRGAWIDNLELVEN